MARRIAIVGGGVSGLSCALQLRRAGHDVTILAEKLTPFTTSDRAGAAFTPPHNPGGDLIQRAVQHSGRVYFDLAEQRPDSGLHLTRFNLVHRSADTPPPWWRVAVRDFREDRPPTGYGRAYSVLMPHIEVPRYMPWLTRAVRAAGVPILEQRVAGPAEVFALGYAVVVLCCGLGARQLTGDAAMRPMRGQVMHVPNRIGLNESYLGEAEGTRATYILAFPDYIVLGGTYEPDEEEEQVFEADLTLVIERCQALLRAAGVDGVEQLGPERLRQWAGLRPVRVVGDSNEAVRLEREAVGPGRWLIHNYGHGRSGITLSWGCAAEVERLVRDL